MTATDPDERARVLAGESLAADDPTGWFEPLYAAAAAGDAVVPWQRGHPHEMLVHWAATQRLRGNGRGALVVGSGPGDDAEYVAGLGFATTAFDVSPTAVRQARLRFPDSAVRYVTADLLDPPTEWRGAFDLVVESYTVQALPPRPAGLRGDAVAAVRRTVAPGGTLVVIASARYDEDSPAEGPPWPLTRAEIDTFASDGLRPMCVEDVRSADDPARGRWRAEFHRPNPSR